jgi:hypothetical protein
MKNPLGDRLRDTVARAEREYNNFDESEVSAATKDGGWSRKQLLGHLIDSASNNHQRFVRALLQDEYRGPTYDQEGLVRVERFQEMPWADLVDLWAGYNRFLAHILDGVPEEKKNTPCYVGENPVMTLEALAEDYLKHMNHHLDQIGRK